MAERIDNGIDLIETLVISKFLTIWVYLQRAVPDKNKTKLKILLLNNEKWDKDSATAW